MQMPNNEYTCDIAGYAKEHAMPFGDIDTRIGDPIYSDEEFLKPNPRGPRTVEVFGGVD